MLGNQFLCQYLNKKFWRHSRLMSVSHGSNKMQNKAVSVWMIKVKVNGNVKKERNAKQVKQAWMMKVKVNEKASSHQPRKPSKMSERSVSKLESPIALPVNKSLTEKSSIYFNQHVVKVSVCFSHLLTAELEWSRGSKQTGHSLPNSSSCFTSLATPLKQKLVITLTLTGQWQEWKWMKSSSPGPASWQHTSLISLAHAKFF